MDFIITVISSLLDISKGIITAKDLTAGISALTVSDVCLKLVCFQSTSTNSALEILYILHCINSLLTYKLKDIFKAHRITHTDDGKICQLTKSQETEGPELWNHLYAQRDSWTVTDPLGTVERRFTFLCMLGEVGDGDGLQEPSAVSTSFTDNRDNIDPLSSAAEATSPAVLLLLLSSSLVGGLSCSNTTLSRSNVRRTSVRPFFRLSNWTLQISYVDTHVAVWCRDCGPATTWTGGCLQKRKPSWYTTNHPGQLSLPSLQGR